MTRRPPVPGLRLVFCLVLGLGVTVCESGPTKHELYMQGMQVEGEASRSECQPAFDAGMDTHVLDGDVVQGCLRKTEEAIALYEKAKAKGLEDLDFIQTYEKALERKKHLESMLRVVRELERPDEVYPGAPPEATHVRE
jgi:hypothetical protein